MLRDVFEEIRDLEVCGWLESAIDDVEE